MAASILRGTFDLLILKAISIGQQHGYGILLRFSFQSAVAVLGLLGAIALVLTALGLCSVASYSVAQRCREIRVHLALGATPRQVTARILREAWNCV